MLCTLAALVCEKIIDIYHYVPSAGAGVTDWRGVRLHFCWAAGQDLRLGAPPGGQFAKASEEEDHRDDGKVAAVDEELREGNKTINNQSYTVGGG